MNSKAGLAVLIIMTVLSFFVLINMVASNEFLPSNVEASNVDVEGSTIEQPLAITKLEIEPLAQAPNSFDCEAVAVTMLLSCKNPDITLDTVKETMPYDSDDPNKGYVNNEDAPVSFTIYPPAFEELVTTYMGGYKNLTGTTLNDVESYIKRNKPVVVWLSDMQYEDVFFTTHTVLVVGYSDKWIYYNDPYTGKEERAYKDTFNAHWAGNNFRALSY